MIKNTYDSLGRITGIAHSHNDKTLADYHYKWDAANRITEINDDKYGYDKTNQLLSAVYAKKPKEQYAYDLNGNRLNHRIGGNNQLLNDGKEEYQYDAEGNRTSKGNTKYHWDHRNRLVKVVSPSETIEYTYDYQNRLVKRSAGKNTTHFIHDGWQIVRQCENGKPVKRFLWGTKQDELICENDNWTLGDHLNTVREVVDVNGKVMSHYDYNAFGKRLNAAESSLQFAYTGKLTDSATNLQWNINRWYDAEVGRWISEDPIGFRGRDINLYRYVRNTSVIKRDSRGLITDSDAQKIVSHWIDAGAIPYTKEAYIKQMLKAKSILDAANDLAVDLMLSGIGLPESYIKKFTVATLKNIVQEMLSSDTDPTDDDQIKQILLKTLGDIGDDVHSLVPVFRQFLRNAMDFSPNECIWAPKSAKSEYAGRMEEIRCNFLVCAKVTSPWWISEIIFGHSIGEWRISGTCRYTCCANSTLKCPDFDGGGLASKKEQKQSIPIEDSGKKL